MMAHYAHLAGIWSRKFASLMIETQNTLSSATKGVMARSGIAGALPMLKAHRMRGKMQIPASNSS